MKKVLALLLTLVLALSLFACGGTDSDADVEKDDKPAKEEVKGEVQTWGKISIFVPEGYEFGHGSITGSDDEDESQCYLRPEGSTSMYDYFWIVVNSEETVKNNISMSKEVNSADDITFKAGDTEWTGCHYLYTTALNGDVDCGTVYRMIGDEAYQVSFAGYATDSAVMTAVLSSIDAAE